MQRDVMREIRATIFPAQRDWRPSAQRRPRPFWSDAHAAPYQFEQDAYTALV